MRIRTSLAVALIVGAAPAHAGPTPLVNQSARQIPVAYQVDVVVVGGGTGAVSAAVAAAEAGAKVFLAAPYAYLGDDVTATLRLWLEPGELPQAPLAKKLFTESAAEALPDPDRLEFTYQTDRPSDRTHRDTSPPSLLTDGAWGTASRESVQFTGDTSVTADLGRRQAVRKVRAVFYQRSSGKGGTNFGVQSVALSTSDDGRAWRQAAVLDCAQPEPATSDRAVTLAAPLETEARYVRFLFRQASGAARILLGEIEVIGPRASRPGAVRTARPMHVKRTLDEALLGAGVPFLYGCYATEVLRDPQGRLRGIVMANRAGRQAVQAKVIIDATDRAVVARLAGARFRPYPAGIHTFRRVVIGGEVQAAANMTARVIGQPLPKATRGPGALGPYPIIEYTLQLPMADAGFASFAKADQHARTLTYHPDQQFTSDILFEVPPDAMHGQASIQGVRQGASGLPLEAFRPDGVDGLLVLGGCADVARDQAEKLLRPLALIELGARLGTAAAAEARSVAGAADIRVAGKPTLRPAAAGDVAETLEGVRPGQKRPPVHCPAAALPVLGVYDVVVIGGGTAGAPAGIAAGRQGAKTLVVESLHGLGGVGTLGAIAGYCAGNRVGFTATVLAGTKDPNRWIIEQKIEWWRKALLEAGADIWYGALGCGALLDHGRVLGAVVATPHGRGVVLAKAVVDATGNADVAAAAGAECIYTGAGELAMQGTGLPARQLGASYANTDFTFTDETDLVDVWHLFVCAKQKYPEAFDLGKLVDTRERRCVVGDFTLGVLDEINGRTYPDTVVQARGGSYDTHGYTVDPYLVIAHPRTSGLIINIPYRAMLPKGLEGILVCGLGISAHRDANPLIRMQPDIQNGGYAAGAAAAIAARSGTLVRNIELRALQEHLVEIGNLAPSVLTDRDSYPLPLESVAAAVKDFPHKPAAASAVFAQPAEALPLVREAYACAAGEARSSYAWLLALLGDATGVETLLAQVAAAEWDDGWNYKAMGQFGNALSPLDGKIVALGRAGDRRATPVLVAKLAALAPESAFSHFRAVALALEMLGDPAAAAPLAQMLRREGIAGYVHASIDDALRLEVPGGPNGVESRRNSLRELALARALYRCGDPEGLGETTLRAYAADLRGHLARHAQAVLAQKK